MAFSHIRAAHMWLEQNQLFLDNLVACQHFCPWYWPCLFALPQTYSSCRNSNNILEYQTTSKVTIMWKGWLWRNCLVNNLLTTSLTAQRNILSLQRRLSCICLTNGGLNILFSELASYLCGSQDSKILRFLLRDGRNLHVLHCLGFASAPEMYPQSLRVVSEIKSFRRVNLFSLLGIG